jgi:sec-independent protein translocase protein TatB
MFDIGWSELLLIGIVALIVIGPKELPAALRTLGQWMTKIRRMASEFQGQFQDAMREAELAELKKEMDDMAAKAQSYGQFDPLEDVRKDIEKSAGDLPPLDTPTTSAPTDIATTPTDGPAADATATDEPRLPLPEPASTPPSTAAAPASVVPDAKPDPGRAA